MLLFFSKMIIILDFNILLIDQIFNFKYIYLMSNYYWTFVVY